MESLILAQDCLPSLSTPFPLKWHSRHKLTKLRVLSAEPEAWRWTYEQLSFFRAPVDNAF
eukprot:1159765-Pelagomonas_calceolata.AAC.23